MSPVAYYTKPPDGVNAWNLSWNRGDRGVRAVVGPGASGRIDRDRIGV
ncbi:MAG: hypothetical protein KJ970_17645 [Candidatus Eisenbacteria bacterium]|uniref:Uncharacterized protein n=1 Tax=Eiseniibacteriota bacterium TaxID=2212470 RepID=A0A948S026_UNCEI|nr:hypothetical protein [Candidatus Eisenbacteria bacterium]